ncbi:MAG: PIN domain-containing protein [Bifidobacteriaceae bacterium]|nr:PIN domain-containing protein [Bifidobacteriaceae bacterium]
MILVDSSVLIPFLAGRDNPAVRVLHQILAEDVPYAICPYVYQEVLQGVADEAGYRRLKAYLDTQECLWLASSLETFADASRLYWRLRRAGVTVRSTIDVLIARTAIEHHALLLHADRDFDLIAAHTPELRVYPTQTGEAG